MNQSLCAIIVMLAGIGSFPALPARGQVTSYVNARGVRVYTNLARPAARPAAPRRAAISLASRRTLETIVESTAERYGLDPNLVRAVVRTESDWNPAAVSPKGAEGLMQLVPATAERFGVRNVFDPAENVEGGVRYLGELLARFGGDLEKSLAAYYAGEEAIVRAAGVPKDPETRAYVRRVSQVYSTGGSTPASGRYRSTLHRAVDHAGRVVYTNE